MATNWKGYFIRSGSSSNDIFPMKYIDEKSWSSSPNFREEIKAYRDENTRNLVRVTASGKKSSFSFDTRENLHLDDKIAIQTFFTSRETSTAQRKIQLTYWNDEDNAYKTSYFYRPNMTFKIKRVTDTDIIYDKLTLEFIEY